MQFVKTFFFLTALLAIGLVLWRMALSGEAKRWVDARFGAVILLPGIGLLTPNIWLYYGVIVLAMIVIPRSRVEAVGLFILISMTVPPSSTTLIAGGVYLIKIDTTRLAALGLIAALRFPGRARLAGKSGRVFDMLFWAMFVLGVALGLRLGEDLTSTLVARTLLENALSIGIPFYVVTHSLRDQADQRRILVYLIMAGFLLSVVAAFEMTRHWALYQSIDTHLGTGNGLSKSMAIRGGLLRSPGPFFESTTFGLFLAITTVATASVRSIFRSSAAHQLAIMVGIVGSFSTLARNGWVGLIFGLVLIGLYRGRVGKVVGIGAVALAGFLVLTVIAPKSGVVGALTGQSGHAAATTDYREKLFTASIPVFKSSPWIGTPMEQLGRRLSSDLRSRKLDVDFVNSYLYFALVSGIFGLSIFVAFLWYPIGRLWSVRRYALSSVSSNEAATAIFACLSAFSLMVLFTSFYERIPLMAALLVGLSRNVYLTARASRPTRVRAPQIGALAHA